MSVTEEFKEFFDGYIEAALWSTNDDSDESGGEPLDANYTVDDFDEESLDCLRFKAGLFFNLYYYAIQKGPNRKTGSWSVFEQGGHDFWLTQNGHGAGFWDGDWDEPDATLLTEGSKKMGEVSLYVGDDGKIYADCQRQDVPKYRNKPPAERSEGDRLFDFFFKKKPGLSGLLYLPSWRPKRGQR